MQQKIWFHKYKILGLLGRGGNAEVYLAEHIILKSFRAIKFISKKHPLYDLQCKEAFILKNLKHSSIPIIYDIEENADGSYIIEQYIEGETLRSYINANGPLCEAKMIQYGLQLCDLLGYLHCAKRPVLYVDLKPDNIILSGNTLKLIDFGSAVFRDELTNGRGYCATKGYAAPELYHKNSIDERCDVYGIGMILYYMATGQELSNGSGLKHVDFTATCSKELKKVINQCLKFNPSQRFISVDGLSKKLSAMIQNKYSHIESSGPITIAVAGSQSRIGVTHLSFRICKYLKKQRRKYLYQEKNISGCVGTIKNCYEEVSVTQGVYCIEGIPMLAYQNKQEPDPEDYQYIVKDYGCLTEENIQDYLSEDRKLLILGAKEWELKFAENILKTTAEYKDIIYLFNFINGRRFQQAMAAMDNKRCFRIPYEPNPFAEIDPKYDADLFYLILNSRN